jgi:UDP-perosamine 4-acetyltransferase
MVEKEKILVVGSGGHTEVVIDILLEMNIYNIIGITTNNILNTREILGFPVIGSDDILCQYKERGINSLALGVGGYKDNGPRKKLFLDLINKDFKLVSAIHPFSSISKSSTLGKGVVISAGSIIHTSATIGDNCIMALNATVGHHTKIENHVLISAGVNVGANVVVGEESLIAIGAKIVSGVKIGKRVMVAAGAVVVNDVGDDERVFGIPAKPKNILSK